MNVSLYYRFKVLRAMKISVNLALDNTIKPQKLKRKIHNSTMTRYVSIDIIIYAF
jgi:hypothetical protein